MVMHQKNQAKPAARDTLLSDFGEEAEASSKGKSSDPDAKRLADQSQDKPKVPTSH